MKIKNASAINFFIRHQEKKSPGLFWIQLQIITFCRSPFNISSIKNKLSILNARFIFYNRKIDLKSIFYLTYFLLFLINPIQSQERALLQDSKLYIQDIPLYTLENDRFTLYEEIGKLREDQYLLLNFTSAFCIPCKIEIPELIKIKESNQNISLLFVFVGDDQPSILKKVKDLNMVGEFKILKDPLKTSLKRLSVSAVPMTYLIMKDKKIITSSLGYTPEKFKVFKSQISEVVK